MKERDDADVLAELFKTRLANDIICYVELVDQKWSHLSIALNATKVFIHVAAFARKKMINLYTSIIKKKYPN
jgi:hypothetical protein